MSSTTEAATGLARIREEFGIPDRFPAGVIDAAAGAAQAKAGMGPAALDGRVDATDLPFVTLDPDGAVDLDQAMAISAEGDAIVLSYAIADVGAFVSPGDPIDEEAWRRGVTVYAPDGAARLYPPALAEAAASLLPDGRRPAVLLTVVVGPDGAVDLRSVARAVVHSRAKLAYEQAGSEVPSLLGELARRVEHADEVRGAWRVDAPEQEVVMDPSAPGGLRLRLRARSRLEDENAAASLAANLAVAVLMDQASCGLFRVMAEPSPRHLRALRDTAASMAIEWPADIGLRALAGTLDQRNPVHAAFLFSARRAGGGADYALWSAETRPWHAAMAAPYAHATAPLRRLADRYVLDVALALSSGSRPDPALLERLALLPKVMARAEDRAAAVDRAAIDLAEAILLRDRVGEVFPAVVTDADGDSARAQIVQPPARVKVAVDGAEPGEQLQLRLRVADPQRRLVEFDVGSRVQAATSR